MIGTKPRFRWDSFAASDTGNVRQVNEDSCLDRPEIGLWVVADGMGGHEAGDLASRLVVQNLAMLSGPRFLGRSVKQIRQSLVQSNRDLVAQSASRGNQVIGTTVVVLLALGRYCAVLWVGDSRIYRLRHGNLQQLTRDHSQVEVLIAEGLIDRSEAENHPAGNVITRAVGGGEELKVDAEIEEILDQDIYLLCSDGLTKELSSQEMTRLLADTTIGNPAEALVASAVEHGGRDNVTAIVTKMYVK